MERKRAANLFDQGHDPMQTSTIRCGTQRVPRAFSQIRAAPMRFLPRKTINRFSGGLIGLLIVLSLSSVLAQTQPATPPLPPLPRLTLTAQDEYVIRENLLNDASLPRQRSAPDTIGDVVPQNIKLEPLPPEIVQKVPKAKAHQFFVKDDDTVVLVSPSDRRVADVIKKKPGD
jgi:hypothetical protein